MSEINQELFKQIRDNFETALQAKTGWGRNDIMNVYNAVSAETTMAFVGSSSSVKEDDEEEVEQPKPKAKKPATAAPVAPKPKKKDVPWDE